MKVKLKLLSAVFFCTIINHSFSQTRITTLNTESILYLGSGKNQPLIVGLGGSEGGNAWSSNY